MGIGGSVARNTLANANAVRDWRAYADLAQSLIGIARRLYAEEPFGVDLKETVYAKTNLKAQRRYSHPVQVIN